jgi:hypothetical protein
MDHVHRQQSEQAVGREGEDALNGQRQRSAQKHKRAVPGREDQRGERSFLRKLGDNITAILRKRR